MLQEVIPQSTSKGNHKSMFGKDVECNEAQFTERCFAKLSTTALNTLI